MLHKSLGGILLFALVLSVAPSSAVIQSRTTTGTAWTGQVVINSDVMRVKIKPYYIDVEEDLILGPYATSGATPPGGLSQLEMWGTFTLPAHAVVVGSFIWNGDSTILKGKLKSKNQAQSQYESVVNRQSAPQPRPRDPMLIEQVGTDQYNIDIYPAVWNSYRKIRIRYLIPQQYVNGELKMPLTFAFAAQVAKVPNWIEVDLKGTSSSSYSMTQVLYDNGQTVSTISLPSTVLRQYGTAPNYIKIPSAAVRQTVLTTMSTGVSTGNFALLSLKVPDSVITRALVSARKTNSVSVAIKNAKKTYSFSLPATISAGTLSFPQLQFAAHSLAAWSPQYTWTLYDTMGALISTYTEGPPNYNLPADTGVVKLFAASDVAFSEVYTSGGFGYLFGVVDPSFSLLALESDTLGRALSNACADSGLPYLRDDEIFKPQIVAVKPGTTGKTADGLLITQAGTNNFRIDFSAVRDLVNEIRILDCKGRTIAQFHAGQFAKNGLIEWNARNAAGVKTASGVYFVTVVCKTGVISRCIFVL